MPNQLRWEPAKLRDNLKMLLVLTHSCMFVFPSTNPLTNVT